MAGRIIILDRRVSTIASFLEASEARVVGYNLLLSSRLRAGGLGKLTFHANHGDVIFNLRFVDN